MARGGDRRRAGDRRPDGARPDCLQPAAVQHALAGDRGRGDPAVRPGGHRPDRLVTDRAGRAHRQVPARPGRSGGSRATDASGSGFIRGYLTDSILARVQELLPVAKEAGLTMAQLAVAWVLQNPSVSAAIVGATRPEQVTENVRASGVRLDDDVMRKIDDTSARRSC